MRVTNERRAGKLKASKNQAYPSLPEEVGKLETSAYCLPTCERTILSIHGIDKVLSRFEGKNSAWRACFELIKGC